MEHSTALPLGLKLREYKILKVLGHGAFGITYLAVDKNLNKMVAIKEYFPNDLAVRIDYCQVAPKTLHDTKDYNWGLQQFLNEAKILATFDHPNIVKVHRFFKMNSTAYFVMDYAVGRSLGEAIAEIETNNEEISEQDVKQLLFPLIDALKIIHDKGCLHRDIKPANIYVRDSDSQPMLLGFGAARFSVGQHSKSISAILTPGYAPVEQYQSSMENQGPWTDIYALAATIYKLLTGQIPVDAFTRYVAISDKNQDALPSIQQISKGQFSTSFLNAIVYGLNIQKEKRPQSALEWQEAFKKNLSPKTGKQFEVYEHPVSGYQAVKKGFSWPLFISGLLLFLPIILLIILGIKKMWLHILAVIITTIVSVIIGEVFIESVLLGEVLISGSDIMFYAIALILAILYGFFGNKWHASSLVKKGYTLVDIVKSQNAETAVAIAVRNNM